MSKPGSSSPIRIAAGAALIGLTAAAVRAAGLAAKPFWIAEVQEFVRAYRDHIGANLDYAAGDFLGFLYHQACHALGLAPTPAVVRLPSMVAGFVLPVALFLGPALTGRFAAGLASGLLAALSLPLVCMSQEGRFYSGLTLFLAVGWLLVLFSNSSGSRKALVVTDTLAVLIHPYALAWIGLRTAVGWLLSRAGLSPHPEHPPGRGTRTAHVLLLSCAAAAQVLGVLWVHGRFRDLHSYFLLQPYPPLPSLLSDLVAHAGAGSLAAAAVAAALVAAGAACLVEDRPDRAVQLSSWAFAGPLVVTTAIWLGSGRYTFVHVMPAAPALYLLAGQALAWLLDLPVSRSVRTAAFAAALVACLVPLGLLLARYEDRPTRLEMGADVRAACEFVARHALPGDAVALRYDKYFSVVAFYCADLPPGVRVVVPELPASEFVRNFVHLGARPGERLLAADRVTTIDAWTAGRSPRSRLLAIVPHYEAIEGRFSEFVGWYTVPDPFGPADPDAYREQPDFDAVRLPLLTVYRLKAHSSLDGSALSARVKTLLTGRRPFM